jgi:ubiquinone biosynthesis protein
MLERVGIRRMVSTFKETVPRWADRLPELPGLDHGSARAGKTGRLKVQTADPVLEEIRDELRELQRRLVHALVGVGLLVSAAILFGMRGETSYSVGPLPLSVWVLGGLGIVTIVAALRGRRR